MLSSVEAKPFRSLGRVYGRARAGTSQRAGGAAVVDVLMYLAFGIVMVVCIWFIDRTLKDDRD